jgi:Rieske Fe-S protein
LAVEDQSRRTFLTQVIAACGAFLAAALGIPSVGAVAGSALQLTGADWITLGQLSSFPADVPTSAEFVIIRTDGWVKTSETRTVWVTRSSSNDVVIFNGRCTHLGCAYHWSANTNEFDCPCHAGVFGKDGRVLGGPPPRPLDTLPTRVTNGLLEVQYQDFREGIPQRVPA